MKNLWLPNLALSAILLAVPVSGLAQTAPVAPAEAGATTTSPAAANPDAHTLFRQAQLLLDAGQTEEACETFERSLELQTGVGTKFNLADCWQRQGRTASAHAMFAEVLTATQQAGQSDRAELAQARIEALSRVLSRVDLQLESHAELSVEVDGKALPKSSLEAPILLDPGPHELTGKRPGFAPWSLKVNVPMGPVLVVLVAPQSEALAPVPSVTPVPAPLPAPVSAPVMAAPTDHNDPARERGPSGSQQALRYSLLGVGVIGLAAGATMTKLFYDSNENAKSICPSSRNCTREEIDTHARYVQDARNSRTWAWIGGGIGVGALVTSIVLWSTDDPSSDESSGVQPWVANADVGASFNGRF